MRYKQFAILLSVVSFLGVLGSCCGTGRQQSWPYPRLEGFQANKKAVVQIIHTYNGIAAEMVLEIATDETGKQKLNPDGSPVMRPKLNPNGTPVMRQTFNPDGSPVIQQMMALGTGSAVKSYGIVLTNAHVVSTSGLDKQDAATYKFSLDEIYMVCTITAGVRDCHKAEVIHADANQDMALLRTDMYFSNVVEFVDDAKFFDRDNLEPEDYAVYFWGNVAWYLPPSPFFGHYLGRVGPPYVKERFFNHLTPLLLMDMTVIPGSSGSPVFNRLGQGIGVAKAITPPIKWERVPGMIIPSNRVMPYLKEHVPPK